MSKLTHLYEVLDGKFGRKDHEGNASLIVAGDFFVPTPSELRSDGYRLRKSEKTVGWDSDEALAALHTVNMKCPECKGFGPDDFEGYAPPAPEPEALTAGSAAVIAAQRRAKTATKAAPATT